MVGVGVIKFMLIAVPGEGGAYFRDSVGFGGDETDVSAGKGWRVMYSHRVIMLWC